MAKPAGVSEDALVRQRAVITIKGWCRAHLTIGAVALTAFLFAIALGCTADRPLPPSREPIPLERVPVQYDDNVSDAFAVSPAQWTSIVALFDDAHDGPSERAAIAQAVAQLERIAGEQTRIGNDGRKNQDRSAGCADCIDESTNTTNFLRLMRERNLLRHNRVMGKAFRGPLQFDIHWTAVVQDLQTREKWAIDSWYNANGIPPIVQPLDDWMRKKVVPGYYAEGTKQ